jgi:hypothetical protein
METNADPLRTALASQLGDDAATALLTRMDRYSNYPNAVKGAAKIPADPQTEAAALTVVEDDALADALGLESASDAGLFGHPTMQFWGLLTLAARADTDVVDRMAGRFEDQEYARKLLATIRRAAAKHAAADVADEPPASTGPDLPQKVSQVKAWLAAHPDADPALLAPQKRQKAAARAAAVRALGTIGTSRALEVLAQYADDRYPDAVLKELHTAWARFDRREFAATMFRQTPHTLGLGMAPSIEGIGAVPGLTSLDVILVDGADLSPLAECTELRTLRVGAEGIPGLLGVEPIVNLPQLTELHLTRMTQYADLTPLSTSGVRRLRLDLWDADGAFLLRMPQLERLLISANAGPVEPHETPALVDVVIALVRRGVQVTAYTHQRDWVTHLLEAAAQAADVFVVETSGYVGLTNQESEQEGLRRRLFSNLVP